jgi:predicted DNA-binding transcriptional regulator AlpA
VSAVEKIPFEELALSAEEVGHILGKSHRTVLEKLACQPDFPKRISIRPASWRAGDILEYRDANRDGRQAHQR